MSPEAIEKHLKKLYRLAEQEALEVEDLLKLVKTPDRQWVAPLREMSAHFGWLPVNDQLQIPFAEWVDAICLYFEQGVDGVITAARQKDASSAFALSLLAEMPPETSLPAFMAIAGAITAEPDEAEHSFIKKYAASLCQVSHTLKKQLPPAATAEAIVPILKQIIAVAEHLADESVKIAAVVSFQAFGRPHDTDYLQTVSFRQNGYAGAEQRIIRQIRKKYA